MNKATILSALVLAVISAGLWYLIDNNSNVEVAASLSSRASSSKELSPKVLTEINKLPAELSLLKKELNALVSDVDEILSEPGNDLFTEMPIQLSATEQIELDNAVRREYEKAGLDYDAEEAVVNNAFNNASSNPEEVLGIKESN